MQCVPCGWIRSQRISGVVTWLLSNGRVVFGVGGRGKGWLVISGEGKCQCGVRFEGVKGLRGWKGGGGEGEGRGRWGEGWGGERREGEGGKVRGGEGGKGRGGEGGEREGREREGEDKDSENNSTITQPHKTLHRSIFWRAAASIDVARGAACIDVARCGMRGMLTGHPTPPSQFRWHAEQSHRVVPQLWQMELPRFENISPLPLMNGQYHPEYHFYMHACMYMHVHACTYMYVHVTWNLMYGLIHPVQSIPPSRQTDSTQETYSQVGGKIRNSYRIFLMWYLWFRIECCHAKVSDTNGMIQLELGKHLQLMVFQ